MNGVVVLCSKTGSLLYGQAYAKDFGLPAEHGGGGGGRPVDELNLAAMLFALHINSRAVVIPGGDDGDGGGGGGGGDGGAGGLQLYEVGHTTLHFGHDREAHVLAVVFLESAAGEEIGRFLAECIVQRFVEKYFSDGPPSDTPTAGTPFKQLRPKASKSLLRGIFQELPGRIFELLLSRISEQLRPPWIFCVMSEEFLAEIDWDDFLAAERVAQTPAAAAGASPGPGGPVESTPRPGSGALGDPLATPVSARWQTPRGVPSTQRKKHIPKVGYRTPKRRWWNASAKPEQFASLGPLQYLYRSEAAGGEAALQPTAPMLSALVGLVRKAGKVLSSVGDVNDRLQSLEVRLRSRTPSSAADAGPALSVTVLRASDDFLIALPGGSGRGYTPALLSHIYEDVLTLRLILRFLSVQKIALPKVVS